MPQVFRPECVDQTALCGLGCQAIHVLAATSVQDFEAQGPPNPAASTAPLQEMLAHPCVAMGGDMVRARMCRICQDLSVWQSSHRQCPTT